MDIIEDLKNGILSLSELVTPVQLIQANLSKLKNHALCLGRTNDLEIRNFIETFDKSPASVFRYPPDKSGIE